MSTRMQSFASPEAAALDGFPSSARVIASLAEGADAYVLMDVHGGYLYGANVHLRDGGWEGGSDGNGPGWTLTDPDHDLGTLTDWDVAPAGADRVRVEWNGELRESGVTNGAYLVAWWRVPSSHTPPRLAAYRIAGEWIERR